MKQQTYINADKILRVKWTPCQKTRFYHWTEAKPEKRFLWWVTEEAKPAGWSNPYGDIVTEKYILAKESQTHFKRHDVLNEHSIWEKARVEIESIGGKYTNSNYVYFESDQEALAYVKSISEKFPHIQIEY